MATVSSVNGFSTASSAPVAGDALAADQQPGLDRAHASKASARFEPDDRVQAATCPIDSGEQRRSTQRRDETEEERLDRNLTELLQELRVAIPGIQFLFAFLLVVPFQQGWVDVTDFEKNVYYVALLLDRGRRRSA